MRTIIKIKRTIAVFVFILFFLLAHGQQSEWITLQDGRFYKDCEPFYPVMLNYSIDLVEALDGSYYISACNPHCPEYFNLCGWDSIRQCGFSKQERQDRIKQELIEISALGFNTIRLCGLGAADYNGQFVIPVQWHEHTTCNMLYWTYTLIPADSPDDYEIVFSCIEQLLGIIEQNNIDLKVMLLPQSGRCDVPNINPQCEDYLSALAARFADNPIIFAYDLYNEPTYMGSICVRDFTKQEIHELTHDWYEAIRQNAPKHLVTYGLWYDDINMGWDPAVIYADFLTFHIYKVAAQNYSLGEQKTANVLKYISQEIKKPWMLGETGFPACEGTDGSECIVSCTNIGSEQQQEDYAEFSLARSRDCGSIGYSWWIYQDMEYGQPDCDLFWGLKNTDNLPDNTDGYGIYKDIIDNSDGITPILDFDTTVVAGGCPFPSLPGNTDFYYNPYNYSDFEVSGTVSANGQPFANALIWYWDFNRVGTLQNGDPIYDLFPYSTYSKPDGTYKLYTPDDFDTISVMWAGAYGYEVSKLGIWYPPVPLPAFLNVQIFPSSVNNPPFTGGTILSGVSEFTMPTTLTQDMILDSGAVVTIKTDFYIKHGIKIIVKPCARLIVDGGRLTGMCGEMWRGIEVRGNPDEPQTTDYQGKLVLKNGAIIENALWGVQVGTSYYGLNAGGILDAQFSTFRNCKYGIKFMPYHNYDANNVLQDNVSAINRCEFITDGPMVNYESPRQFIQLWQTEGVKINGCTFTNNTPSLYAPAQRGYGIYSVGSRFIVDGICIVPVPYGGSCPPASLIRSQ
ncbi:MAG: cellulase family glycosylhydrolase, partial [Bacteroidia bacterium]|nr:cellulase family glycosylhydrolase [Bacteroidia bacterium]